MEQQIKQKLNSYFPHKAHKIVTALLLVLVLCFGAFLLIRSAAPRIPEEPIPFTGLEETGWSSMTITNISDPFTDADKTYYFVMDEDGYFSIAMIPGELTADLTALKQGAGSAEILGRSEPVEGTLVTAAVDAFNTMAGSAIVNADNLDQYLGGWYLDTAGSPILPLPFPTVPVILFAVAAVILLAVLFVTLLPLLRRGRQIRALSSKNCRTLLAELEQGTPLEHTALVLGNDMLVTDAEPLAVRYEDILWFYQSTQRGGKWMTLGLKDGSTVAVAKEAADPAAARADLETVTKALLAHCGSSLLIGYDAAKKKKYLSLCDR